MAFDAGQTTKSKDYFGLAERSSSVALARMFGSGLLQDPDSLLSKRLSYVDDCLKVKGGKRLAELIIEDRGQALQNLRSLDLSNCSLSSDAAAKLAGMLNRQPVLQTLSLANNQLCGKHNGLLGWQGDHTITAFEQVCNALPRTVTELDFSQNCLQSSGSQVLAAYVHRLPQLKVLRLVSCQLSCKCI